MSGVLHSPRPTTALRRRRSLWGAATALLALASFALAWTGREPLLREAADLWIVSDSVIYADAIVVLGGDFQMRPRLAADFYGRGVANKILISQVADAPHIRGRASLSHTELN